MLLFLWFMSMADDRIKPKDKTAPNNGLDSAAQRLTSEYVDASQLNSLRGQKVGSSQENEQHSIDTVNKSFPQNSNPLKGGFRDSIPSGDSGARPGEVSTDSHSIFSS